MPSKKLVCAVDNADDNESKNPCPHMSFAKPRSRTKITASVSINGNCYLNMDSEFKGCDTDAGDRMVVWIRDNRRRGKAIPIKWEAQSKDPLRVSIANGHGEWSEKVDNLFWVAPYYGMVKSPFLAKKIVLVNTTHIGAFCRVPIESSFKVGIQGSFEETVELLVARLGVGVCGGNESDSKVRENSPDRYETSATVAEIQNAPNKNVKPSTKLPMNDCKILFFASNPFDSKPLMLDEEVREIETKIRAADYRDNLTLISKWAVRPDDLIQTLNEQSNACIVHFSGHGSASNEIILCDDHGMTKPVSNVALSALFRTFKGNIRLVVLNACFSQPQAESIVEHIECAMGMNNAIGDKAAINFAASVYRAIGFGKSVQEAFDQGITSLLLEGIPEENIPKLLCKKGVNASNVHIFRPE